MGQECKNQDCRNYVAVDVVKGICHAIKEIVYADGETCKSFEKLPKCRYCQNYTPGPEAYLGICEASPTKTMTYPDLIGLNCEQFEWKMV